MMTAKQYLKQLEALEGEAERLKFELRIAQNDLTEITALNYNRLNVQNGTPPHEAGFEKKIDRICELQSEIAGKITELDLKRYEIISVLNGMKNILHSRLLFMIYVEHKTLKTCSSELGYSYDYVVQLHRAALSHVKVPAA